MPKKKSKPNKKPKPPKAEESKTFRVAWMLAAPFLMRPHRWQLLEVETDKKGKMTAVLQAKS